MPTGTIEKSISLAEKLLERAHEHFPPQDLDLLKRACTFVDEHYAHIVHPSIKSYNEYILYVATYLLETGASAVVIAAALISLPPTVAREIFNDLKKEFKEEQELLQLVNEVQGISRLEWSPWLDSSEESELKERQETLQKMFLLAIGDPESENRAQDLFTVTHFQKKEKQVENLIRMFLAAATDIRSLIIKLADRLCFVKLLRGLQQTSNEVIQYTLFAKITLVVYAPLADRLGLWRLKSDLEDMAFRFLKPDQYEIIVRKFAERKQERKDYIDHHVIPVVKKKLIEFGMKAWVSGRAKHIYSIYQKMEAKELEFEQINDLLGIRVIVESIDECYLTQAIIHEYWLPVTKVYDGQIGRDWIVTPKANDYRSLHTTVKFEEKEVEVQIRTREMHEKAEYGPAAAHWRYKEEKTYRKGKTPRETGMKDRIWSEQLAKVRRDLESSDPIGESLSKDWVYVITPEGHVVDLSAGATPLDFAYRIHSDIGHTYLGARVNSRSVRMNHTLRNGDVVEISSSHSRKGPSPNWLSRRRLDTEEMDAALVELLASGIEKDPLPQWLHQSEKMNRSKKKRGKGNKGDESQDEKQYTYYVFARTRQARSKIQNWLNKQKTEDQVKNSIKFEWYPWALWDDIRQAGLNKSRSVSIPRESGVYEVRRTDRNPDERLIIGRADNLECRIREELVKGDRILSAKRQQILAEVNGDTPKLEVRWATTEFHAELEGMLHRRYKKRFGGLPKYVDRT